MSKLKAEIDDFVKRIKTTLNIRDDDVLTNRKILLKWIVQTLNDIKKSYDTQQKRESQKGVFRKLFTKDKNDGTEIAKMKEVEKQLLILQTYLLERSDKIPSSFVIPNDVNVPVEVLSIIELLKSRQSNLSSYQIIGTFFGVQYISKQSAEQLLSFKQKNNLKINRINPDIVHKCQRVLVSEIIGRTYRDQGTLSMVVQVIPIKQNISPTYYLIQDTLLQNQISIPFADLRYDQLLETIHTKDDKQLLVNQDKFIELLMGQLMTLQLQSFSSQFGCVQYESNGKKQLRLVKYFNYKIENEKQFAGLRNNLFFFKEYYSNHQIEISKIQNIIYKQNTYNRFFTSLQILIDMKKNDFEVSIGNASDKKIKVPSLLFPQESVETLFSIFHKILVLRGWLDEVVKPLRQTISLSSIISQICFLLNVINLAGVQTPAQYGVLMNKLDIGSFLSERLDKNDLYNYLNEYRPISIDGLIKSYSDHLNCFDAKILFAKFLDLIDLQNYMPQQAAHLIQIFLHNTSQLFSNKLSIQWKNVKVWRTIFTVISENKSDFTLLDLGVQMAPYFLGLDPVSFGFTDYFNLIKNTQQTPKKINDIVQFARYMMTQFNDIFNDRLELLLDKCFIYRKTKIATKLLQTIPIRKLGYKHLLEMIKDPILSQQSKTRLLNSLQKQHPSRYRKFKWQQIFLSHFQKQEDNVEYISVQTFDFGQCFIRKDIIKKVLKKNDDMFSLQTKTLNKKGDNKTDYMYTLKHDIAKIQQPNYSLYIQQTETPGFDYFFGKLLETLDISYIKPYTTYFKLHNHVLQFTQYLTDGFTFPEAFRTYKQDHIRSLVDKDILTQAIIISLLINPSHIGFDDIVLKVYRESKFHIYIKSFESYNAYAYSTMEPKLKMKNAFLLFGVMHESVSQSIMMKYSKMNIQQKIRDLYKQLKNFCTRMEEMQSKQDDGDGYFKYKNLFLAIPFQNDFVIRFSQRFQRISDIFNKSLKYNTTVTHFDLLQKLSPAVGIYYKCLNQMQINSNKRWRAVQQSNKFQINFVEGSLFSFFSSFSQYQIQQQRFYPNNLQKLQFIGVSQCLLRLKQQQSKNKIFQNQQEQDIINLLLNQTGQNIQFFMRNIDMRLYKPQTQRYLLDIYRQLSVKYLVDKKYRAFESLYIIGCSIIEQKTLNNFGFERVKYLVLENCSVITQYEIKYLSEKLQCMTYLRLHKIQSLNCISVSKSLSPAFGQPIKFAVLNTLVISMCQNLAFIDIKSSALANVQLKRNFKLESIYLNSKNLQKISSISNPQLRIQNIGLYIFSGIDVYIDEKSCFGDIKKIIPFQNDMSYAKKVYELLKYIISNFNDVKCKTNLCLTLFKTNNLEQNFNNNVAAFISSFLRLFSGNFKIDLQIQTQVFFELIKCFIRNPKLQDIIISQQYLKQHQSELNKRLKQGLLSCLSLIHEQKSYKLLRNLTFQKVSENTLEKVFQFSKIFRADQQLSVFINTYDAHIQKYNNILFSLGQSVSINKIKLSLVDSNIQDSLFKDIADRLNHKLISLQLTNCSKVVSILDNTVHLDKCHSLSIINCEFNNFSFITSFKNVLTLEISNCQIHNFISLFFSINQLNKLQCLKLNNLFQSPVDVKEFTQNMTHTKIRILDLSNNIFESTDIQLIDKYLSHVSVFQFILTGWGLKGNYNFSKFLKQSKVKQVTISFVELLHINQFIQALAINQNIISANIQPDQQYTGYNFNPLRDRKNQVLEHLHMNIRLPLWVVDILNKNIGKKITRVSKIYPIQDFNHKKIEYYPSNNRTEAVKVGLSLDGGGMRGYLLASQLSYLADKVGYPLHKIFDWIGGTSIGGILALASTGTLNGKDPVCRTNELKEIFTLHGQKIFEKHRLQIITNLYSSKYPGQGIEGVLNDYFKSCKLSDVLSQTNCIVTSVKRLDNTVKLFNSKQARLFNLKDFYMRDVGRATSAAPIYFPSAQIKNVSLTKNYSLIDGGVGQNNPSKIVIQQLKKSATNAGIDGRYFLLSLGTGKTMSEQKIIPTNPGFRNLAPIIDSFMQSNSYFVQKEIQTNHKGKYLRVSPVLKLSPKDLQLDNTRAEVLREYQKIGQQTAQLAFSQDARFGQHGDRSLIEWLSENTRRKYQ